MSGDQQPTNNQQQPAPKLNSSFSLTEIPDLVDFAPLIQKNPNQWQCTLSLNGRTIIYERLTASSGIKKDIALYHQLSDYPKDIDLTKVNIPVQYVIHDTNCLSNNYYLGDGQYVFDIGGRYIAGGNPDTVVITSEFLSSPSSSLCLDLRDFEKANLTRFGASLIVHYPAGGTIQILNFDNLINQWNDAQFSYRFQILFQDAKVNVQGKEKIWSLGEAPGADFYRTLLHDPQEEQAAYYSQAGATFFAEKGIMGLSSIRSYENPDVVKWVIPFDPAYDVYLEEQNFSAKLGALTTDTTSVSQRYKSHLDYWEMDGLKGLVAINTTIYTDYWSGIRPFMSLVQLKFKQPGNHKIKLGYIDTNHRLKWWYQSVQVDNSLVSKK